MATTKKRYKEEDLKFKGWVKQFGGYAAVAKHFNVSHWTVFNWLKGGGCPEVHTIIKILELSRGTPCELTFDDIYKECTRNAEIPTGKKKKEVIINFPPKAKSSSKE